MDSRSYKTISANKDTVEKKWIVVDVEGKILGRAASEIAKILRGKHKPSFTPHVDCGDNVIVINADKIRLTGKKWDDKVYLRHSGYPGGQKATTAKEMLAKHPIRLVEKAVKGMLPKNSLGRKVYGNMRVYVGTEHPHAAQEPVAYEI
ncbi:50S ribosomal protein L13 [Pontibacter sp. G13]|uniref:50S ribosomal protein L13 n=1 Tax=Pontibacter sp. G13 TaxID=3074898 RepID=UPI00288A1796|nr:50S ribosomal protein L13 [Pontibacter sp. G13]WNJ16963.1 50S ribosomal protein L13 [Pontibacter sp. G13]